METGTAQVVFANGRLVLSAHTQYDRQLLVDHVLDCVRRWPEFRVRVDYTTWTVERANTQSPLTCRGCARHVDRAVCRRPGKRTTVYCVSCALARPRLTVALLAQLPAAAILRDIQAYYAYGREWIPWMRWPQATPAEIIEDMRLQRRFAPVLTWTCTEIRRPPAASRPARRQLPRALRIGFERSAPSVSSSSAMQVRKAV